MSFAGPTSPKPISVPISPRKPLTPAANLPSVAQVKLISPKEKRQALAENEARRARVKSDQLARVEAAKLEAQKNAKEREQKLNEKHTQQYKLEKEAFFESIAKQRAEEEEAEKNRTGPKLSARRTGIKLGMKVAMATSNLIQVLKVVDVTRGNAAWFADVEVGDHIKTVNGRVIQSKEDWDKEVALFKPSTAVPLGIWREGFSVTCHVHCKIHPGPINANDSPEPDEEQQLPASAQ